MDGRKPSVCICFATLYVFPVFTEGWPGYSLNCPHMLVSLVSPTGNDLGEEVLRVFTAALIKHSPAKSNIQIGKHTRVSQKVKGFLISRSVGW
jgi:hypothetical protein